MRTARRVGGRQRPSSFRRAPRCRVGVGVFPSAPGSTLANPPATLEPPLHARSVSCLGAVLSPGSTPRGPTEVRRTDLLLLRWGQEVYFPL